MLFNGDHGGGGGAGMDYMGGVQTMGIVNAMKTGDLYLDMLIAMLIPLFLRFAFDLFNRFNNHLQWETIRKWWKSRCFKYERTIVYKFQRTSWGTTNDWDEDTQNTVLLKAIRFYLHQCCKLDFRDATLDLTTLGRQQSHDRYDYYDDVTNGGTNNADEDEKTMVGTLSKYKIVPKPKDSTWHVVGKFDGYEVQIMQTEFEEERHPDGNNNNNADRSTTSTKTFHFVSPGKTSIDTFIQTAYDWYLDQLRSLEDHSRYLYEIRATSGSSGGGGGKMESGGEDGGGVVYNRYRLSDEKTFESLFFRQKKSLLSLIGHFQHKTGKYSIKGYPHKLGLLLHGVPGTGKTSLIKALAHHTGRSIVNIPLSRIETNSELMDIFFAKRYCVRDQDVPVKLGFKDVIFVLEDVDASSKVVKRRVAAESTATVPSRPDLVIKSPWQMLLESNDDDSREVVKLLMEKSERLRVAAQQADVLSALANRIGSVPGLGVIGSREVDRETRDEAIQMADSTMAALETVDRFVTLHAKTIKSLLLDETAGTTVDDHITSTFEDALLGCGSGYNDGLMKNAVSGQSEMVGEGGGGDVRDDVQQQMVLQAAMAMSATETSNNYTNGGASGGGMGPSLFAKPKKDELNLSGLLNVLDGVVDTPGRIVILTTNHPELLDPALIRPGRIDKKILLGYMNWADMVEMVELYFQTILEEDQADRLRRIASCLSLTPAELEQLAAENDLVEDLLVQLEDRAGLTAATSETTGSDFR